MTNGPTQALLDFYTQPGPMTSMRGYEARAKAFPDDVRAVVSLIQQLLVYEVVAADFYGFDLPEDRAGEIHIRPVEQMLDRLMTLDDTPLPSPRAVEHRLACRCRDFTVFLVAVLRAKGVAARARNGFAGYLNPGYFEDHQVCEYWSHHEQRWVLVDTQIDAIWRAKLNLELDHLDVPRDQFLVAGEAWRRCRSGAGDPARFGIGFADLRGLWFVAASLIRDLAALNKAEMLPWDVWGAQPPPDDELDDEQLAFFDGLAELLSDPDTAFDDLRDAYESDERLRVPTTVLNALLDRPERIG